MLLTDLGVESISKIFVCIGYNPGLATNFRRTSLRISRIANEIDSVNWVKTQEVRLICEKDPKIRWRPVKVAACQLRIFEENKSKHIKGAAAALCVPFPDPSSSIFGYFGYGSNTTNNARNIIGVGFRLLCRLLVQARGFETLSIWGFEVTQDLLALLMHILPNKITNINFRKCIFKISESDLTNWIRRFSPSGLCLHGQFTEPIVNDLHTTLVTGNMKIQNTHPNSRAKKENTFSFTNITDISLQNWYYNNTESVDLNKQRTRLTFEAVWNFIKKVTSRPNLKPKYFDFGKLCPIFNIRQVILAQRDKGFNWTGPMKKSIVLYYSVTHKKTGIVLKFQYERKYYKTTKKRKQEQRINRRR